MDLVSGVTSSNLISKFLKNVESNVDPSRFLQNFDKYLQHCFITTTSLRNILDGKVDKKRQSQQLFLMVLYVYLILRFSFLCWLYTEDQDTMTYWQHHYADHLEQLGVLGRVLNACYVIFSFGVLADKLILYRFESKSCLYFLTDVMEIQLQPHITDPQILKSMNRKVLISKWMQRLGPLATVVIYNTLAVGLFVYNETPSFPVLLVVIVHYAVAVYGADKGFQHLFCLNCSFVINTDFVMLRIQLIMKQIQELKTDLTNLTGILSDCDSLILMFRRQNLSLLYLLQNFVYFYCTALSCVFLLAILNMYPALKFVTVTGVAIFSMFMMSVGIYISQLKKRIDILYKQLNSLSSRLLRVNPRFINVKIHLRLRMLIKELGNQEKDGQFVLGFTDGSGGATSSFEIYGLTATSVSNSLMAMKLIKEWAG